MFTILQLVWAKLLLSGSNARKNKCYSYMMGILKPWIMHPISNWIISLELSIKSKPFDTYSNFAQENILSKNIWKWTL